MTSLNKSLKPWLFGTCRLCGGGCGGSPAVLPPIVLCGAEDDDHWTTSASNPESYCHCILKTRRERIVST